MHPSISIIVPVYNAEVYLSDCLNSILSQTFLKYEVILVDDDSTDGSLQILNKFQAEDSRFKCYHQRHKGVSSARNVGLKYAIGDYVCFVDADDQIASTYLEELYQAIGEADSSMCGFKKRDLLSNKECIVVPEKKVETLEENLLSFYAAGSDDWQRYLWNRMFKRDIIQKNKITFNEDIYYKEDGLFFVKYLCSSNGLVGCVDHVLYYYYRTPFGAMSKTWYNFDEKIITNLEAHRLMIKEIRKQNVSDVVLLKAISQAKAASTWIISLMRQTKSFKLSSFISIERIMFSILGSREYFSWRVSQLIKLLK